MAGEGILDFDGENVNTDAGGTTRRVRRYPGAEEEEFCNPEFGTQADFRREMRVFDNVTCNEETARGGVGDPRLKCRGDVLMGIPGRGRIPVRRRCPDLET